MNQKFQRAAEGARQTAGNDPGEIASWVWSQMCSHIEGIAMGTTASALRQFGVFNRLFRSDGPVSLSGLAKDFGLRPGYLHLALRLLETQAFVHRSGDLTLGHGQVEFTADGRSWYELLPAYELLPVMIDTALAAADCFAGKQPWNKRALAAIKKGCATPPLDLKTRVLLHVAGPVVGAIMRELDRRHAWADILDGRNNPAWRLALAVLSRQGWIRVDEAGVHLTTAGEFARRWSSLYWVPISYLPTFRNVPEFLREGCGTRARADATGVEWHVDRALDIAASGVVFDHFCKEPFLDIVLPLFDDPDLAAQPVAVVDTGSGDASLLIALYQAIATRTRRGRHLGQYPLTMIGAEFNPIAQETSAQRLHSAGIPNLTLFGDIGDPAGLTQNLQRLGVDPLRVLHVSKSVVHNRVYEPPRNSAAFLPWVPLSKGVFVDRDGNLILPEQLELNLIEHFQKWKARIGRHGMVVIEAHAVDSSLSPELASRWLVTAIEASHGYSHQYLVEPRVYQRCATAAGLKSLNSRKLAEPVTGRLLFSLDHFIVDPTPG